MSLGRTHPPTHMLSSDVFCIQYLICAPTSVLQWGLSPHSSTEVGGRTAGEALPYWSTGVGRRGACPENSTCFSVPLTHRISNRFMVKSITGSALGGIRGGKARAERMTPEERSASARHAAKARWENRTDAQRREDLTIVRQARPSYARSVLVDKGVSV